ncbi:MAG: hypothetical protein Tsb005_12210 [Gammaproteobacteria bacterium]
MDTILEISIIDQHKYKFTVSFENNENQSEELPIDKLANSAEMVGFHFEINSKRLEPVDFRVVSKEVYCSTMMQPNEKVSLEFIGKLEKRGTKYYCLSFENASYIIIPGEKYKVWFSLNGYASETLEVSFID